MTCPYQCTQSHYSYFNLFAEHIHLISSVFIIYLNTVWLFGVTPVAYVRTNLGVLPIDNDSAYLLILLLLAAPTQKWGHTILLHPFPPWTPSFVVPIALMSRLTQFTHLCFGLPLFLLPGGTISSLSSDVFFVPPLHVSKPPQSRFPAPLCDILYIQSLPDVIISHMVSQCVVRPHAHLHIFVSVTSSFFSWEIVIGTLSIPYCIAG